MRVLAVFALLIYLLPLFAQSTSNPPDNNGPPSEPPALQDYVCPMDKDVRSDKPGSCPRCGMKLVLGIPDENEYPLDLKISPRGFKAGQPVDFNLRIADPKTGKTVDHFEIVHDKLFHLFVVSEDLQFF